ncbi:hypothetical protein EVAR_46829_1 [Eumeta japonica]|uniref:Uncharacterized protein n=1 Tax=Eumeta variegata TaxID=151549 RepID=A0A4C2A652_EUMVA|nr:hypothetical protein EVAR_46829_1 [Eumeta japonica]
MRTGEVPFGIQNVCGGMDDKTDHVCKLTKDRRLDILFYWIKRKGVCAPDISKPIEEREEFWADVKNILINCNKTKRLYY